MRNLDKTQTTTQREYILDRFRNGQLMAEGFKCTASSFNEAVKKAAKFYPWQDTFAERKDDN